MAEFSKALPYVLKHEGGWSNDPDDPGGATNFGITLRVAQQHGILDANALLKITPAQVAEIYRFGHWRYDSVDDQRIATKLLDMAVNVGPKTAHRLLQSALNDLGASLDIDGIWGIHTLSSVNAARPDKLLPLLCEELANYYTAIATNRPASAKFLKGWLNRAKEIPE